MNMIYTGNEKVMKQVELAATVGVAVFTYGAFAAASPLIATACATMAFASYALFDTVVLGALRNERKQTEAPNFDVKVDLVRKS